MVGYLLLLRPVRCSNCEAVSWRILPVSQAPLNYPVCFLFWGAMFLLTTFIANRVTTIPPEPGRLGAGHPEVRPPKLVEFKPESDLKAGPEVSDEANARGQSEEGQISVAAVNAAPDVSSDAAADPAPEPARLTAPKTDAVPTSPVAEKVEEPEQTNSLSRIDVNSSNFVAIVDLHTFEGVDSYEVTQSPSSGSFILDLKGSWRVARRVEQRIEVGHRNLREIAVGKHSNYLRIVFRLHELREDSLELLKMDSGMRLWIR